MQDSEAKKILLALDGLGANLETIRNLVLSSIEEEKPIASKGSKLLDLIPDDICLHDDILQLETLGKRSTLCNKCGIEL